MVAPILLAGAISACDQGVVDLDERWGPSPRVVARSPESGAGTACDELGPDNCGVPRDAAIELRFDRYLLPASAVRQSTLLYTTDPSQAVFTRGKYDLIERVMRYRQERSLAPNTQYTIEFVVPTDDDNFGFRAFDGRPIDESGGPLRSNFFTSRVDGPELPEPDPTPTPTCKQVLSIFVAGGCTQCHLDTLSGPTVGDCPPGTAPPLAGEDCVGVPRQGLDLSSSAGLLLTAINQVAHQTELGGQAAEPLENPDRLGIQMPVIDPGRPGNSYLMYKLLINPKNFGKPGEDTGSRYAVDLPSGQLGPTEEERERLREWFVRGAPMPKREEGMALQDFRALQSWIQAGAPTSNCF